MTSSCGSAGASPSTTGVCAVCGASAGIGCGFAGAEVVRAIGVAPVCGAGSAAAVRSGCRAPARLLRGAAGPRQSARIRDLVAACSASTFSSGASPTIGMLEVGVGSVTGW